MRRRVSSRELEIGMSAKEVAELEACPDCRGHGNLSTPARNWNRKVKCATCSGSGLVMRLDASAGRKEEGR